jgi:hypothetical protein
MRYQNALHQVLLLRANDLGFHTTTTSAAVDFRFTPNNGHDHVSRIGLLSADCVAKVVLQEVSKILRAAGAFFV